MEPIALIGHDGFYEGLTPKRVGLLATPLFANNSFLTQKYTVEGLSARQIGVLIGSAHSTINSALIRLGIAKEKRRSGWLEYGIKWENGRRVPHVRQQRLIESMAKKRSHGWSYSAICEWLEDRGIRSPSGQKRWFPGSVKKLLKLRDSEPQVLAYPK